MNRFMYSELEVPPALFGCELVEMNTRQMTDSEDVPGVPFVKDAKPAIEFKLPSPTAPTAPTSPAVAAPLVDSDNDEKPKANSRFSWLPVAFKGHLNKRDALLLLSSVYLALIALCGFYISSPLNDAGRLALTGGSIAFVVVANVVAAHKNTWAKQIDMRIQPKQPVIVFGPGR